MNDTKAPDNHLIYTKDVAELVIVCNPGPIFTVVAYTHDGQHLNASSWRTLEAAEHVRDHYRRQVEVGDDCSDGATILVPPSSIAASSRALRERVTTLEDGLRAIILRCEEGSPDTDWLPTIARIGRGALFGGVGDDYGEWTDDEWRQAAHEASVRDDREGVDEQEARHSRELSEMRERWYEAADDRNEP